MFFKLILHLDTACWMCPEFFRWGEGIVVGCLNLLNKIVKSFTEQIISWMLNPKFSKKMRKQVIHQESVRHELMKTFAFIHEARFTGLFSFLWIAKTPLKVCYTNISMISFYKLTFLVLIVVSLHHLELCEIWWLLIQAEVL